MADLTAYMKVLEFDLDPGVTDDAVRVDAGNHRTDEAVVIECRVTAAVVVNVSIGLDEFGPANIERYYAALGPSQPVRAVTPRTRHGAGGQ